MAVDISKVFKANVKAIRVNQGDNTASDLLKTKKKSEAATSKEQQIFVKETKNIVSNVTILKQFLNDNKKYYIQPNYLVSQTDELNNIDWQRFEDEAEGIIRKCADAICQLKDRTFKHKYTPQVQEHLNNVFYLLEKYLKDVCKFYSEQKAIRVKRIVEKKNFSQLCTSDISKIALKNDDLKNSSSNKMFNQDLDNEVNKKFTSIESDLSPEELQELEKENERLYDDLSVQTEEIKKIESQVIEVSKLTQIFAENIVAQLSSVERVQKAAVDVNSNLTMGNESIKDAMKKNAALRLWILFIILVLSFTLLFLDWYND